MGTPWEQEEQQGSNHQERQDEHGLKKSGAGGEDLWLRKQSWVWFQSVSFWWPYSIIIVSAWCTETAACLLEKREGTSHSFFWRLFVGAILTDHTFVNFYTAFDLSPSLSQIHLLLMPTHFFFNFFYFFTYPIKFVILWHSWICEIPLEHSWPTDGNILKEDLLSPCSNYQLPIPQQEARVQVHFPPTCWDMIWLEVDLVLCMPSQLLGIHRSCVQGTLFPCIHLSPLALTVFLQPNSQ